MKKKDSVAIIIAFFVVSKVVDYVPELDKYYYGIIFMALGFIIFRSGTYRISTAMVMLHMACAISIILNDIPDFFSPWLRFLAFMIVTGVVSPFIYNQALGRFRMNLFFNIQNLLLVVVATSLIGMFMGVGWGYGGFGGITGHSMLLAPVAALSFLYLLYLYFNDDLTLPRWKRRGMKALMPISALFALMSASRTSFIALVVSVVFFLFMTWKKSQSRVVKSVLISAVLLMITSPLWLPVAYEGIIKKNRGSLTGLDFSTRSASWEQGIDTFKSSPWFGVGFSSVDIESKEALYSAEGKVETGSSWLMLLSMTGLLGFVPVLWLFLKSGFSLWQIRFDMPVLSSFLMAQLVFWSIHMLGEGYILAAGSFLFFNCWLLLGVIQFLKGKPVSYNSRSRIIAGDSSG